MAGPNTAPLAFLDTETDGIHPGRKPWEIAIVRRETDGTETQWSAFIEIDLSTADPYGLKVGGFYDRHPLGQYLARQRAQRPTTQKTTYIRGNDTFVASDLTSLQDAADAIAAFTHGAHVVGAVPNFDTEILDRLLRRQGLAPSWHYHLIDIENLAAGYLAANGNVFTPPWSSDALTEALGLEPVDEDERHTAMGDVRWAMRVYDFVMRTEQSNFRKAAA